MKKEEKRLRSSHSFIPSSSEFKAVTTANRCKHTFIHEIYPCRRKHIHPCMGRWVVRAGLANPIGIRPQSFWAPPPRPLQTYYLTTIGNLGNGSGTQNKRDRMGMWSGEQEEPSTDRHGDRELTRVKGVATPPPPPLRPFRVPRLDVAARISCYLHCAPRIAAAAAIARLHSTQSLTRCVAWSQSGWFPSLAMLSGLGGEGFPVSVRYLSAASAADEMRCQVFGREWGSTISVVALLHAARGSFFVVYSKEKIFSLGVQGLEIGFWRVGCDGAEFWVECVVWWWVRVAEAEFWDARFGCFLRIGFVTGEGLLHDILCVCVGCVSEWGGIRVSASWCCPLCV